MWWQKSPNLPIVLCVCPSLGGLFDGCKENRWKEHTPETFLFFFSDSFEASPPKEGVFETCCLHWEDIPTQAINILWSGSWNGRRGPFIRKGLLTTDLGRFLRRFGFCLIFGNIQSFILTVSFRYWCSTRDPGYLTRSGYFSLDSAKVERSSQSQSGPAMSLEDQVSYFNIN